MGVIVTDHAVLRYLERAFGLDIEDVRRQVAETPGLASAVALGAKSFSHGGLVFHLSQTTKTVLTVIEATSPMASHLNGGARRGSNPKMKGDRSRAEQGRARRRYARGAHP